MLGLEPVTRMTKEGKTEMVWTVKDDAGWMKRYTLIDVDVSRQTGRLF